MRHQHSKFLLFQAILLILSLLILLNFFSVAGRLDLQLIQPFVDAQAEFPLRQDWALAELNHRYVKYILIVVYLSYIYVNYSFVVRFLRKIPGWLLANRSLGLPVSLLVIPIPDPYTM